MYFCFGDCDRKRPHTKQERNHSQIVVVLATGLTVIFDVRLVVDTTHKTFVFHAPFQNIKTSPSTQGIGIKMPSLTAMAPVSLNTRAVPGCSWRAKFLGSCLKGPELWTLALRGTFYAKPPPRKDPESWDQFPYNFSYLSSHL